VDSRHLRRYGGASMTPPRLDEGSEREAFEAWFRDVFMDGMDDAGEWDAERNCYVTHQVHMAWKGWQYRATLSTGRLGGEWVSVGDRLPETYQRVMVLTTDANDEPMHEIAHFNGRTVGFLGDKGRRIKPVTHWQALTLPAAPSTQGGQHGE
jgi:hypothetical protein